MSATSAAEIGRLYESEAAGLRATIRGIVHDREAAEDLVRGWARLPDHDHLRGWLRRIAVNLALDHLRRRRRELAVAPQLYRWVASDDGLARVEDRDQLADLLRPLDAGQRALLVAHVGGEARRTDLAARLGVPEGTVASRLHKAMTRARMRRQVARHG